MRREVAGNRTGRRLNGRGGRPEDGLAGIHRHSWHHAVFCGVPNSKRREEVNRYMSCPEDPAPRRGRLLQATGREDESGNAGRERPRKADGHPSAAESSHGLRPRAGTQGSQVRERSGHRWRPGPGRPGRPGKRGSRARREAGGS